MDKNIKYFVGLDVHKDTIAVSVANAGRAKARVLGTVAHDMTRLAAALAKLGDPEQMHVVYEAGPTGYGLHRWLLEQGYTNEVIAPSLTPKRAGDRIKTDRRDSARLAELSRAGELSAIHVPDHADEAMRDLSRAREGAVQARLKARQLLKAMLLRHDKTFPGKTSWTKTYYAWLGSVTFGHEAQQIAFTEMHLAVQAADQRVQRLAEAMIRMKGMVPYLDIMIKTTGLRPGEKLHEELTYADERLISTGIDGLNKVTPESRKSEPDGFHEQLDQLLSIAGERQQKRALYALAQLVPAYNPPVCEG